MQLLKMWRLHLVQPAELTAAQLTICSYFKTCQVQESSLGKTKQKGVPLGNIICLLNVKKLEEKELNFIQGWELSRFTLYLLERI